MANEEHVMQLQQGIDAWNRWRDKHWKVQPDLSGANLTGMYPGRMALTGTIPDQVDFAGVDLTTAHFARADLAWADLTGDHLIGANLRGADLTRADLRRADLARANLSGADLTRACLFRANLHEVLLGGVELTGANLARADFTGANIGWTVFGDVNLSTVRGLDTLRHFGPSTIGINTLYRSQGNIPEAFLPGAGVPEDMISYSKSLVGQPFQYYSCFISYSSRDEALAQCLHADLQANEVRCWFAPEDLKIGDEFRSRIDESIRVYDRLLLILSESSVISRWVQKEVETAFEKESKEDRIVLFPIRIDEAVMQSAVGWAADIRRMRHIGDFRQWKDHDACQHAFQRLLRDLKAGI
jgi:uncharacterized protein YjbI with pentapeptide repeats